MAKDLTTVEIDDLSVWDGFVELSPQGTVFSSSKWVQAAGAVQGGEPRFIAVMKDGKPVAGVAYIHIVRGPLKKATSPMLTPYGGILYRPDPGKRSSESESFNMSCAEHLIDYVKARYNNVFFVHSPGFTDVRPFSWSKWKEKIQYTYILDITDPDKLWDILERRVRTVIRNAESSLTLGGAIDMSEFADLYSRIYSDRGRGLPFASSQVTAMAGAILDSDIGEMRSVTDDKGDVISAMILVKDTDCVYSWISGSIPGVNSSGAFSLLFWDAVKRYSANCSRLDMVGANIESIAFFKKGFGGALTPYYVTEYYSSLFTRAIFSSYTKIRGMLAGK